MVRKICFQLAHRFVASALLLVGLGISSVQALGLTATLSDQDRQVSLKKGDTISISLPTTPGTGFAWIIVERPQCLALQVDKIIGGEAKPGATQTWVAEMKVTGDCDGPLVAHYKRSWEANAPAKTFRLVIIAK